MTEQEYEQYEDLIEAVRLDVEIELALQEALADDTL